MSTPKHPDPAKLVIGCIMNDKTLVDGLFPFLEEQFGPVDMISRWMEFAYTDYYYKEMGSPLFRKVFVFKPLIAQEELARIKERTNEIEERFAISGKRNINIDPGYLVSSRFILATGKEYSHRIYIGRKVYADLTLMYSKKQGFKTLPWTYPDYASQSMIAFLSKVRDKYLLDLKARKNT
ncbi:MAG: GTP-binding protein [Desulfobacterales bacterium RIFOXYA12_FULL_46_15]|nr:MAG: GTP-binding protein [Desulfobacula sp. GWF2_41_7]OGR23258.1 MAG: GTP-binding protein [Desulfobacterales bacterium RIFOXYA12_FULL_46_15]